MTLDPVAEKGVGHPDFQRIAVAAEPQPHAVAEPETEPCLAQPLGNRRAQRGLHDRRALSRGSRPGLIPRLLRVSRHGAIPRERRAQRNRAHAIALFEDWGGSIRRMHHSVLPIHPNAPK